MVEDINQELDICLNATDTHFFQRTEGFPDRADKCPVVGNNFYKKTVIIWQDFCAGIGVTAIQTKACAGTGTVYVDTSCIRKEVILPGLLW